ncbi:MAG: 3'-5' exonuclease [Desulfobacterales bacterium]|nr:3'-5' exonuclease [Desulfobacterales bacterium]
MIGPSNIKPPDWEKRFTKLAQEASDPRLKDFYQASCVPLSTPVSQVRFLALDLETTGLDIKTDAIVSIGFVPMTYNRVICQGARNWTIRPEQSPESPLAEIHGITHTHLETSPGFNDSLSHILKAMAGHIVVAHYCDIEREFLDKACREFTGETLQFPVVDTMELESRKHPVFRPNVFQRWLGDKPSPSLRLSHSRERYGLPRYTPHHALTDALATAELLMAQLADRYLPHTPIGKLWI